MNISPELTYAIITLFCSIVGSWYVMGWRLNNLEKRRDEDERKWADDRKESVKKREEVDEAQWNVITKVREWITLHERESGEKRVEFERRFGELSSSISATRVQYTDLTRRMDDFANKMDSLANKMDQLIQSRSHSND